MATHEIVINSRLEEYIKAIQEAEGKKSFSRVVNYLIVLGIDKYKKLYNLEPEIFDTSFFDFDKKSGSHNYDVEPSLNALKREKIRKRLIELGRSFFENDVGGGKNE